MSLAYALRLGWSAGVTDSPLVEPTDGHRTRIKICGITTVEDAERAAEIGADFLGLNFWPHSRRHCDVNVAQAIVARLGNVVRTVGVFVDQDLEEIRRVQQATGVALLQLHGAEAPDLLDELGEGAFKAIRVASESPIAEVERYGRSLVLLDRHDDLAPGGTGRTFDWSLAIPAARRFRVLLAGGLSAENVADAIRVVRPFGVDVASGVEAKPGRKDVAKMHAFMAAVHAVDAGSDALWCPR